MRLELVLLSALAAATLAALIDSARRAASADAIDAELLGPSSAALEALERARARLDDHPARVLIASGLAASLAGVLASLLGALEIAAVLFAAGAGLAVPGLRWAGDVRRERQALGARIGALRERLTSSSRSSRAAPRRSAEPLPRS